MYLTETSLQSWNDYGFKLLQVFAVKHILDTKETIMRLVNSINSINSLNSINSINSVNKTASAMSTILTLALLCTTLGNHAHADALIQQPEKIPAASASVGASASATPPASTPASIIPAIEFKNINDARAAKAAKLKEDRKKEAQEEQEAEDVASKIAKKLALIRKEKTNQAAYSPPANRYFAAPKAAPVPTLKKSLDWHYDGEYGPEQWGKMHPNFAQCGTGERQSPIDIRDGFSVELDPLQFDYKQTKFNVIDNGHTIQVGVSPGQYVRISGKLFELVQFHFHKPAEERINGKGFAMVVHLLHKDTDGKLAVVAILIEPGKANEVVQAAWNNLPLEKNTTVKALQDIDLSQLLPKAQTYYTYMGSLTTPPCSEGVLWIVMKEPIEISSDQISIFNRLYPMNARPLQKAHERMIKESR